MLVSEIGSVIHAVSQHVATPDAKVSRLLTDSRRLISPDDTLFFGIVTSRNNGCRYARGLYDSGVRSFVMPVDGGMMPEDANVWYVDDVVKALQALAAYHRAQYSYPVVGITGSNGKTIVKDWLVQLLSPDRHIVSSPKSYNSQIGVPLSVWQMSSDHDLGIFEAGISESGEMDALRNVIAPTIGLFTNVGSAHDENFLTRGQKVAEKLQLFTHCNVLIYCIDHKDIHSMISDIERFRQIERFTLGISDDCDVQLLSTDVTSSSTTFTIRAARLFPERDEFTVTIPFADRASQQNAMHCVALMLYLGYKPDDVAARVAKLTPVEMRLELNEGIGGCLLINDSYSLDMGSLSIALDYLAHQQQHYRRTLIMSDMLQSGVADNELYSQVATLLQQRQVSRFIGIGPALSRCKSLFEGLETSFFDTTDDFLHHYDMNLFRNESILLKGARVFGFEHIAKVLQRKSHETVMEVNLDALVDNLNYHRSLLRPGTKLMAMVKASSYGAGTVEVASALQFNHADYLTVAYVDEGVELRRNGITLPIMVMNPEEAGFDDIIRFRLEPDIYSFRIMELFADYVRSAAPVLDNAKNVMPFPIHIEFDTGMHRLGFSGADVPKLKERLANYANVLEVRSVFSHLACSEDPAMDDFTHCQIERLKEWSKDLPGIKHILNSSGITRFPEAQMDMVRLGIGLYGISPDAEVQSHLRQVSRLVTRISQIKEVPEGDTVGYNCRWRASRASRIAIITVGYADGLHRGLGNGNGRVLIGQKEAPIIGAVCMDMCFVDVTDVDCVEGDRAILFGEGDLLQRNAAAAGTIPYELLTAVSPRVKRVYYHES